MSKGLNYIGIARKSGTIETGEENTAMLIKSGKAKLVIVASDTSPNAKKRAQGYVFSSAVPIVEIPYTKQELSDITGKAGCSMAALTDIGLASSFVSALKDEFGEKYETAAAELDAKRQKAAQRQKEAKAHQRNAKHGKRRKSV